MRGKKQAQGHSQHLGHQPPQSLLPSVTSQRGGALHCYGGGKQEAAEGVGGDTETAGGNVTAGAATVGSGAILASSEGSCWTTTPIPTEIPVEMLR